MRSLNRESLREVQRELSSPSVPSEGKRLRRKSWLRYASDRTAHLDTLRAWEEHAPGIVHIVLHPSWRVLGSDQPLLLWRRHVLPHLLGHLRGLWISMERQRCGVHAVRRWMREAARQSTMDTLCLLAGLFLLSLEMGKSRLAISASRAMIRTLIIEHSTCPITPFIWRLFDFYQATLWERLPSDTFEGYDFRVACSAAEPMRLLIESNPILAKRLSLDSVLLPGPTWKNLAPAEEPAKQVFRLRYSLCGTVASLDSIAGLDTSAENWHGFVIDARNSPLWMKHVSREQRSAQEGLFLERVNDEFGRNQLEMRPGPLTVGFAGSVYFVGRLSDDEDWIENPRARYPMRYTVRPRHRPGQSPATELHEFRRFPSNARLQYFGPEFRPV